MSQMPNGGEWTTQSELRAQVERCWFSGQLLRGDVEFPLALKLRRPDDRALSDRFDEVREWIRDLTGLPGYQIEWTEVDHRVLGRNRVPSGIVVPNESMAFEIIGKGRDAARYREIVATTCQRLPALSEWLRRKPLAALEHVADWNRILDVLLWFRDHPRCGLYLRQLDIPGVDTKFIETRLLLFSELLGIVLPADALDPCPPLPRNFERRYGLHAKPLLVRFRILDPSIDLGGLTDLSIPAEDFAHIHMPAERVFITENEINGLTFPSSPKSIVIFGLGYGLERLSGVDWLREKELYYWGDIDTHGFHILDLMRARFSHTKSLLMDRDTLLEHRAAWVCEEEPFAGELPRLTAEENALYQDLRANRYGDRVRLEPERIAYSWVERRLRR
jgi:hypothetical protein